MKSDRDKNMCHRYSEEHIGCGRDAQYVPSNVQNKITQFFKFLKNHTISQA